MFSVGTDRRGSPLCRKRPQKRKCCHNGEFSKLIPSASKRKERDLEAFQEIMDEVRSADGVLWSFGLWVPCVPAQYMRFIKLISERGMEDAFEN